MYTSAVFTRTLNTFYKYKGFHEAAFILLKSTLLEIRSYITIYMYTNQDNLFVELNDSGSQ